MISERRITSNRYVLAITAIGATVLALVWIRAALQMAHCGFDVSDEGMYVLSYRWWNVNYRTYTGTQYLFGPVFQLVGWDVAKLRIFRFLILAASHVLFGWTFMRWLRLRRPNAPTSVLWEVTGTALIVAASGMHVSWLPLSPGYNDVAMLGAVFATTGALRIATLVERREKLPWWLFAAFGPLIVGVAFAKWTTAVTVFGPTLLVVGIVVLERGWREVARGCAWLGAGALVFAILIELFVVRFERAIPEMIEVNRLLVKGGYSPANLLKIYWDTTVDLLKQTKEYELLFVAAAVAVVSRTRPAQLLAAVLTYFAADRAITRIESAHALQGGTNNLAHYPITILTVALTALVMVVTAFVSAGLTYFRRSRQPSFVKDSLRGWLVLGLIALYPISHGFGTGNAIAFMAINGFAAWMAIIIALATGFDRESLAARWFGYALAAGGALAAVLIAKSGLLEGAYRTHPYASSTAIAAGVEPLAGVRLRPDVAREWSDLRAALKPHLETGRGIAAFDELAGIVFLLGGRPIGEPWNSALDHERAAEGFRSTCRAGKPWWSARGPILIFKRGVTATETNAFRDCGIDFHAQYRLLPVSSQTMGLQVYVPSNE